MHYALFLVPVVTMLLHRTRAWWLGAMLLLAAAAYVIYLVFADASARGIWMFAASAFITFLAIYAWVLRASRRPEAERLPVATVVSDDRRPD